MMTREELLAALAAAEELIRQDDRWEYDRLTNAEANGACRALAALKRALLGERVES